MIFILNAMLVLNRGFSNKWGFYEAVEEKSRMNYTMKV